MSGLRNDLFILFGQPFLRIDQVKDNVGMFQALHRADNRVILDILFYLCLAPNPGSVLNDKLSAFIEKLAFQEPYQAILFANRTELSDYLMNRYDIEWEQPNAIPFIMENDQLMDGYRPNPYKVGANSNSPSL